MGTQPSKKIPKRNTKIQSRKIQAELDKCKNEEDYKKVAATISKATQDVSPNYLVGILAAGIAAYSTKTQSEEIISKVSGDSIIKIPKNIKESLTVEQKRSIREAIYDTMIKRGEN